MSSGQCGDPQKLRLRTIYSNDYHYIIAINSNSYLLGLIKWAEFSGDSLKLLFSLIGERDMGLGGVTALSLLIGENVGGASSLATPRKEEAKGSIPLSP